MLTEKNRRYTWKFRSFLSALGHRCLEDDDVVPPRRVITKTNPSLRLRVQSPEMGCAYDDVGTYPRPECTSLDGDNLDEELCKNGAYSAGAQFTGMRVLSDLQSPYSGHLIENSVCVQ